jgi:general secretion pathway protein K
VLRLRIVGLQQMRALMKGLAIPEADAAIISDSVADWIDSDDAPAPNGAEDGSYQGRTVPYRTAGRLIGDVSEIRAVRGMSAQFYERMRPWLCALPGAELSPINVNTLRPDQALLLTMIAPGAIPAERARALLSARPALGWASADDALRGIGGEGAGGVPLNQLQVRSRWFLLTQTVTVDSASVEEQALIDVGATPARVAFRTWGDRASR